MPTANQAIAASQSTQFTASDILQNARHTRFKQGQHTNFGNGQLDAVPADKLSEFFTVTLSAKKIVGNAQTR